MRLMPINSKLFTLPILYWVFLWMVDVGLGFRQSGGTLPWDAVKSLGKSPGVYCFNLG